MPKTIGILGGMGSWATLNFFRQILGLSEPDEFRIIIDNNVEIPSRTLAVRDNEISTGEMRLELLTSLGQLAYNVWNMTGPPHTRKPDLAGVIAVPCNSAHYWYCYEPLWLNMLEVVSDAVKAQGYSRPLILGGYVTVEKRLYSKYLPEAAYLDEEGNAVIYKAIEFFKQGGIARDQFGFLWKDLPKHDCVLLACTELSLINSGCWTAVSRKPIIDSSLEYAKATVKHARGG